MIQNRRLAEGLEIRRTDDVEVRSFVSAHEDADPYHDPRWRDLLARCFGYEALVLAQTASDQVAGVVPLCLVAPHWGARRLVSLPFSHDVRPLCRDQGSADALLRGLRLAATALQCSRVEIRGALPAAEGFLPQSPLVQTTVAVAATDQAQLGLMKESTRQQTSQGLRLAGLEVSTAASIADLQVAHRLVSQTRRRKGSLTYPRKLFEGLLPWVESGKCLVEVARLQGRAIATTVTVCQGTKAIYLYGGSLGDVEALRARPYNVLLFRALSYARGKGASTLDLGTSLPTQTGLIRFKEGLGGTSASIAYLSWPQAVSRPRQEGAAARLAGSILKRLPQPLFERITPLIMREVG